MIGRFPRQFGKYVLLKPLAKGGMGEIYLAAVGDVGGFEKMCVIKKVITEKADRTKANRFLDEAKVVLRLSHAALVNTFDAGEAGGEFYIAMELVEGKDLREVWNRCVRMKQRIPLDVALHVVREVARALAYVHDYGDLKLVHRDVAPPNIMLAYVGDVKLTDFGLARSVLKQEHTVPGVVFGRAAYLAPEQARGEVADERTDIYTLGIVLWELLTGQQFLQLSGLDPAAALAIVRHPKIAPPSARAPWIKPSLDQVVMRALAPDRARRYQTAEELRQALSIVTAELAPQTDAARVSEFLKGIYTETIAEERAERERFLRDELPLFRGAPMETAAPPPAPPPSDQALPVRPKITTRADVPSKSPASSRPTPMNENVRRGGGPRLPGLTAGPPGENLKQPRPTPPTLQATFPERALPRPAAATAPPRTAQVSEASSPRARFLSVKLITKTAAGELHTATRSDGSTATIRFPALRPGTSRATPDNAALDGFRSDARRAAQLRHPAIAETIEVGIWDDGRPYVVHGQLNGVDLAALITHEQRLDPLRALGLVRQLCKGLAVAHEKQLFHRAITPGSVFIVGPGTVDESPRLLDFGVASLTVDPLVRAQAARAAKSDPARRRMLGEPPPPGLIEYLAPEQLRGQPGDEKSDVYALGCLLYEMVTGAPPHAGAPDLADRKLQVPPQSPRMFHPDLSEDLERLILATLDRDPARRPPGPADLERLILALPVYSSVAARSTGRPAAPDRERRRLARDAAFQVIADLCSESQMPPATGPASVPPIVSGAREPAEPGPSALRVLAAPSALQSVAPAFAFSGTSALPPAPAMGGGMMARYGVPPDGLPSASSRGTWIIVALIIVGAAAVFGVVRATPEPSPRSSGGVHK